MYEQGRDLAPNASTGADPPSPSSLALHLGLAGKVADRYLPTLSPLPNIRDCIAAVTYVERVDPSPYRYYFRRAASELLVTSDHGLPKLPLELYGELESVTLSSSSGLVVLLDSSDLLTTTLGLEMANQLIKKSAVSYQLKKGLADFGDGIVQWLNRITGGETDGLSLRLEPPWKTSLDLDSQYFHRDGRDDTAPHRRFIFQVFGERTCCLPSSDVTTTQLVEYAREKASMAQRLWRTEQELAELIELERRDVFLQRFENFETEVKQFIDFQRRPPFIREGEEAIELGGKGLVSCFWSQGDCRSRLLHSSPMDRRKPRALFVADVRVD